MVTVFRLSRDASPLYRLSTGPSSRSDPQMHLRF